MGCACQELWEGGGGGGGGVVIGRDQRLENPKVQILIQDECVRKKKTLTDDKDERDCVSLIASSTVRWIESSKPRGDFTTSTTN